MKVILPTPKKDNEEETICLEEINNHFLVMTIIDKNPCILTNNSGYNETFKNSGFRVINNGFAKGNSYGAGHILGKEPKVQTIQQIVQHFLVNYPERKLEVFHEKDWKKALQWLINNCE